MPPPIARHATLRRLLIRYAAAMPQPRCKIRLLLLPLIIFFQPRYADGAMIFRDADADECCLRFLFTLRCYGYTPRQRCALLLRAHMLPCF